ncbi:MAG: hypothetical protein IKE75_00955, partial [Bacilli bacterium]|nr:hypothetical protein [Bacilli bacterium]
MGVGYAAFSSLLTINGTANISNSWCVGFDNTKTNDMQITKGLSTGTTPTGSMSYSGTACGSTLQPNSSLNAHFYQPGDQIEYTLTIVNKSTVTAAIKSILVDNESVTSNTTKKKGNITYVVEMPVDTTLDVNESTTMKVIAKFQNETPVTGNVNGEMQSIEVKINAEQDDGNGGFTPTLAVQTVYAWNTTPVTIGTSTINDLASYKTAQPYYTSAADVMNASGYTLFNKYTIENDTITEEYSCQTFGISGFEPVCLKMSTDGSEYEYDAGGNHTGNVGTLNALNSNTAFTSNDPAGSCDFGVEFSQCRLGRRGRAAIDSSGSVNVDGYWDAEYCSVWSGGEAFCNYHE